MRRLLPPCEDATAYEALATDKTQFLDAVRAIAARHDVIPPQPSNMLPGSDVVYRSGTEHVIKMVAPPFREEHEREAAALQRVALSVPTPTVIHRDEIEGWPYLIMTQLGGSPAHALLMQGSEAAVCGLVENVGRLLRALHEDEAASNTEFPGATWSAFRSERIGAFAGQQHRRGLPESYITVATRWLETHASTAELASDRACLVHADLHAHNLHIDDSQTSPRIVGLVDFGDARIAPPLYDLVTPAVFFARGKKTRLDALYRGYGLTPEACEAHGFVEAVMACALMHPFNDMERWLGFCGSSRDDLPRSLDAFVPFARRLILGD